MEFKDIKPAIARQKVMWCGEAYDVMGADEEAGEIVLMNKCGHVFQPTVPEIELIPESPRPFRVGDRVATVWKGDIQRFTTITSVALCKHGDVESVMGYGDTRLKSVIPQFPEYRHCTPEEEAKYFS